MLFFVLGVYKAVIFWERHLYRVAREINGSSS